MDTERARPAALLVDPETFRSTVVRMLRPRGGRRPWPKKRLERWVLLHYASRRVEPGESLSEKQANQRLQDWLLGPADRLDLDFVTLRRTLIDEGFWDRDSGGTNYRRTRVHESRVRFAGELPDESVLLADADTAAVRRTAESGDGGFPPA